MMSAKVDNSVTSEDDEKKLDNIRLINQILSKAASDHQLQQDLQKPMVRLAMDHWSGRAVHATKAKEIVDCSSVMAVYPMMKELETLCDSVNMKVPLDHIEESKSELSKEAMVIAFGDNFLLEHGLCKERIEDVGTNVQTLGKLEYGGTEINRITANPSCVGSGSSILDSVTGGDFFTFFYDGLMSTPLMNKKLHNDTETVTISPSTVLAVPFTPPTIDNKGNHADDDTWKWQHTPKKVMNPDQGAFKMGLEEELQHVAISLEAVAISRGGDDAAMEVPATASGVFIIFIFYLACLVGSLIYSGRYDFNCTEHLPWVGHQNATNIVMARLKGLENEYKAALLRDKWVSIRSEPNFTVEVMEGKNGQRPLYVRTTAIYPVRPADLYKRFKLDNFDSTMKAINPLYESSKLLFSPATKFFFPAHGIDIMKIISSPLFKVLPRRKLTAAVVETALGKSIRLSNIRVLNNDTVNARHLIDPLMTKIPRGTLIKAVLTVNVDENSLPVQGEKLVSTPMDVSKTLTPPTESPLIVRCETFFQHYMDKMEMKAHLSLCRTVVSFPQAVFAHITRTLRSCEGLVADLVAATTRYKNIRQDLISYFVPLRQGNTLLIVVMVLDPGDDIPHWAQNQLLAQYGSTVHTALRVAH